jgi:uncharacterized protein (TIGR02246 family)
MSQPTDQANKTDEHSDDQKIRALIDAWGEASAAGDLAAQLNLMTHDVVFLISGRAPMRRDEFAAQFRTMMEIATFNVRSNVQEITVSGDLAVCWNLLEVSFTPNEGGDIRKHAGNVLTALRRGPDGRWRIWRDANLLTPA